MDKEAEVLVMEKLEHAKNVEQVFIVKERGMV